MIKIKPNIIAPILSLFLFSTSVTAQELHTYIDRDSVQVGDIITYILVLERDQDYRSVIFPDEEHFDDDDLRLLDKNHHSVSANKDSVVYHLQFFGVEDYQIPRYDLELTNQDGDTTTIQSNPIPLFFKTVIAEGDEEFRPLKPIFLFAASFWPWIIGFLLLAGIGYLIYRWMSHRETKPDPAPPRQIPFNNPLQILKERIDVLSGPDSPLAERNFKEFYVLLGDAIREYFEEVYRIKALEMTSREILRELRNYPAENEIISITRKVLFEADMVKFAKFEPDVPQAEQALVVARQFIEVVHKTDKYRIEKLREEHSQSQISTTEQVSI